MNVASPDVDQRDMDGRIKEFLGICFNNSSKPFSSCVVSRRAVGEPLEFKLYDLDNSIAFTFDESKGEGEKLSVYPFTLVHF